MELQLKDGETLCEVIGDGLDASGDGRGFDARHHAAFTLANAAPDLLEAAELGVDLIQAWMNGVCRRAGVTWASEKDHPPGLQKLRAAIAKARA